MAATTHQLTARVRLAAPDDVPKIHRMIHKLAIFERFTHLFTATETLLSSTLFPSHNPLPPFHSFTVLILDLNPSPPPLHPQPHPHFDPVLRQIHIDSPVDDDLAKAELFASSDGWVVAGFVHFFPNYSTFLAKPGFYVEGLFVREAYRRRGLGKMLLSTVAAQAARMGMGRVEWCVLDWNINAIKFYEEMGADVLQEWRICRLTGSALEAYGGEDQAKGE